MSPKRKKRSAEPGHLVGPTRPVVAISPFVIPHLYVVEFNKHP